MNKIVELQNTATTGILISKWKYKQQLLTLKLLTLSLYIEILDFLYLIDLKNGKYDVELTEI